MIKIVLRKGVYIIVMKILVVIVNKFVINVRDWFLVLIEKIEWASGGIIVSVIMMEVISVKVLV